MKVYVRPRFYFPTQVCAFISSRDRDRDWSNVLENKVISSCHDCPANKNNNHQGERLTNDTLKTVNKGKNMEIISVENRDSPSARQI
jgi:hypothetical protein